MIQTNDYGNENHICVNYFQQQSVSHKFRFVSFFVFVFAVEIDTNLGQFPAFIHELIFYLKNACTSKK